MLILHIACSHDEQTKGRVPRHRQPRDDPREDVGVGVVECGLNDRRL